MKVTTPLRTALDLGCHLRRREAMATLDALASLHGVTQGDLLRELGRFRGRRGVVQLRGLIPFLDSRIESQRESWVKITIADAGLPLPESQVWIEVDGVPTYRLDHAYLKARIAVEYDGWEFHERTAEQRRHDRDRRRWLVEHGWRVIVVRRGDFSDPGLATWLEKLRRALEEVYSSRRW